MSGIILDPIQVTTDEQAFLSVASADEYFADNVLAEAWTMQTEAKKTAALKQAASIIDRLQFRGKPTTTQDHAWPRVLTPNTASVTPKDIISAHYEVALALLKGVDPDREYRDLATKSQMFGALRTDRDTAMISDHIVAGVPSRVAWNLMLPYLVDVRTVSIVHS